MMKIQRIALLLALACAAGLILSGCSKKWSRRDAEAEAEMETEEIVIVEPEALPEPDFGEGGLIDDTDTSQLDETLIADRGDRIENEVYGEPEGDGLKTVYFDFDKYQLRPDAVEVLKSNAAFLIANPHINVLIEGHCDDRGSSEYNLSLGEKRAKEVRDYFIEANIAPDRIKIISYGEERPAVPNGTEEGWAKNRRAEFRVQQ